MRPSPARVQSPPTEDVLMEQRRRLLSLASLYVRDCSCRPVRLEGGAAQQLLSYNEHNGVFFSLGRIAAQCAHCKSETVEVKRDQYPLTWSDVMSADLKSTHSGFCYRCNRKQEVR